MMAFRSDGGLRSSHIAFDTRGESPARSQAEELNAGMPEERLRAYGGGGRKMWRIQAVTSPFDGGRDERGDERTTRGGATGMGFGEDWARFPAVGLVAALGLRGELSCLVGVDNGSF